MVQRIIPARADGLGAWTAGGKQQIAHRMQEKGRAFVASAILLRQQDGDEFVVLHLLCQGIEVLGKGYLTSVDYDHYYPKLSTKYRHNLVKILNEVARVSGLSILKGEVQPEIAQLSKRYADNHLRYGSALDLLVDPAEVSSSAVLRRLAAVFRYADKFDNVEKTSQ